MVPFPAPVGPSPIASFRAASEPYLPVHPPLPPLPPDAATPLPVEAPVAMVPIAPRSPNPAATLRPSPRLPLMDVDSGYIVANDRESVALFRVSKDEIVSRVAFEETDSLVARFDHPESMIEMTNVTKGYDDHGLPIGAFSHRGMQVIFSEPNLVIYEEATGKSIYMRQATWWSAPQPPAWPGQEGLPPEQRFQCPAPSAYLAGAWVAADHHAMLLQIEYSQPVCVCGDSGMHGLHVIALPLAPGPAPEQPPV